MKSFLVFMFLTLSFKRSLGLLEIYEKQNFDELAYQGSVGAACFRLTGGLSYLSGIPSMKTDECLEVFNGDNCETNSVPIIPPKYGIYLPAGDYADMASVFSGTSLPAGTQVKSLKRASSSSCSNSEEAFEAVFYNVADNPDPAGSNEILRYQRVCGCTNLPSQIIPTIRSIQNPGKCVRLFSGKNCGGIETKVPAYNEYPDPSKTTTIHVTGKNSISTCEAVPSCMTVRADVFKVDIVGDAYEIQNMTINDIDELGSQATFENRGSGMVSSEYHHSHTFRERLTLTVSENLNKLTVSEANDIEYTSNAQFPAFAKTKIIDAISDKFRPSPPARSSREFEAGETIQIPPCQRYKVNSYVTGVQNYEVKFTVSARFTGHLGTSDSSHILTQTQLQHVAKDLGFQSSIVGSSVVVKVNATIVASLGMEAVVIQESTEIGFCSGSASLASATLFTVLLFSAFSYLFNY